MHKKVLKSFMDLRWLIVLIGLFFIVESSMPVLACQKADGEEVLWETLTRCAITRAWQQMGMIPDSEAVIVLTNAGSAVIDDHTTALCLDTLHKWTGASIGKGTLVNMHSARTVPLWFFFYNQNTGYGTYCEVNGQTVAYLLMGDHRPRRIYNEIAGMRSNVLFSKISTANIAYDYLLEDDNRYAALINKKSFNGNEFRIISIVSGIAYGMPYALLQSVKFHDHYCPGVTSGYFIADYIEKSLPGDNYFYFSVPPWCKDDAIQVVLNTTPGKSGYAVTYLNDEDKANLKSEFKNEYNNSILAGIIYVKSSGVWQAYVLGFDFDRVREEIGKSINLAAYPSFSKIIMDIEMLKMNPWDYVSILKVIPLPDGKQPSDYARPGVNILEAAGLVN